MTNTWIDIRTLPDSTAPLLARFRRQLRQQPAVEPTGLSRRDYLKIIAGNVGYFRKHQNDHGAIIDPHQDVEWQYATPCFALAAATVVVHSDRDDLLEPAAKAMDWACHTLSRREAATRHEDFYPPQLAHALPLLGSRVDRARAAKWEEDLRSYDPFMIHRAGPGGGNWNVVALSGEALLHLQGIRTDATFVETCLAAQGRHFRSPWGLYTEGPMAYDHFPRLWAADMLAGGYVGQNTPPLAEALRRGAITSLFMQSPCGELPVGGRSAHHQWNEAEQCVTFEIYAAKALRDGDEELAGVFKRAARLALRSIMRWVRPSGELWIVKNRVDPAERHGYEGYSAHSQYNLLAMAMLAIAFEHSEISDDVAECTTPAEIGGFVLDLREVFYKIIANAGGMYVELDVAADPKHNATGLLRIHRRNHNPQLGPSDGITATPVFHLPPGPRTSVAVGAAWQDRAGRWRRLAEYPRSSIIRANLLNVHESPGEVSFQVLYQAHFAGPSLVVEHYRLTPAAVELRVELPDYTGPARMIWPVLEDIGDQKTRITIGGNTVAVELGDDRQSFTAIGAASIGMEDDRYPFRNGWARLAIAEYDPGTEIRFEISDFRQPITTDQ